MQQTTFRLPSFQRGYHLITDLIEDALSEMTLPKVGMLQLFIQHTSAGLTINENADPTVRVDFETMVNRIVPEHQEGIIHTYEGADDMPAHIKSSLMSCSVMIPITNGRMNLGTWQGIYLCEFRNHGGSRRIIATTW